MNYVHPVNSIKNLFVVCQEKYFHFFKNITNADLCYNVIWGMHVGMDFPRKFGESEHAHLEEFLEMATRGGVSTA
jgi:hypothetical protein